MHLIKRNNNKPLLIFIFLWILVTLLYIPTLKAGFVTDFSAWYDQLHHFTLWEYMNRKGSGNHSLYQFTQLVTFLIYKVFGVNMWLWSMLFITLQAINSFLLFKLFRNLFIDAAFRNASVISLSGVILFVVCPQLSEVVVWKPSYHYLQGFLFILIILLWVQKFHHTRKIKYAWWSCILYFISTYTLEIFYITPWLVLALTLYYRVVLHYDNVILKKVVRYFFLPQILFFLLHLVQLHLIFHDWVTHIGSKGLASHSMAYFLSKPIKYFFQVLFFGRFFNSHICDRVYALSENTIVLIIFYSIFLLLTFITVSRFKKMNRKIQTATFTFILVLIAFVPIIPVGFSSSMLVYGDRYAYLLSAFTYMTIAISLSMITIRFIAISLWSAYVLINIFFTIKTNIYWKRSAYVVNRLLTGFPDPGNKTVLLLNEPECMQGIPMLYANPDGAFKSLYNALMPDTITNSVYDISSFNIVHMQDGAHVRVLNDSTVRVTLNQWGTWWLYNSLGALSYETEAYKVNMIDEGHMYELTLKHPYTQYMLLYEDNCMWKKVDWNKKDVDQP